MKKVIGIDVGGTKILTGLFDYKDLVNPEKKLRIDTNAEEGREKVLEKIIAEIEKARDKDTESVGISWAGFVDAKKGVIKKSPNLPGFEDFPLEDFLTEKICLPVFIENDARLFALAEQKTGEEESSVFLGIIFGTGVGSGIIQNGKVFSGAQNFAGEIGHQYLLDEKLGKSSSAEELFAGPGLEKFLGESLIEIQKKCKNDLDFEKEIREKMALRVEKISTWIYNLILVINPEKIVFGGSVGMHFWPMFFDEISMKIYEKIATQNLPLNVKIEKAKLENAGLVGAASLAYGLTRD